MLPHFANEAQTMPARAMNVFDIVRHAIESLRKFTYLHVIAAGLAITVIQIMFFLVAQGRASLIESYQNIYRWDSVWYEEIAGKGYFSHVPPSPEHLSLSVDKLNPMTNVAFFPGYPLAGRLVRFITGINIHNSLVMASWLACWAFWTYFLLLMKKMEIKSGALVVLLSLVFPSSFFMVAEYSESLFMASMCGYMYWYSQDTRTGRILAVIHGMIMTSTRIAGLPIVFLPMVYEYSDWFRHRNVARLRNALDISLLAALGGIAFFAYCQYAFGHWDLYFLRQKWGWGLEADYFFLFRENSPLFKWTPISRHLHSDQLSLLATTVMLWAMPVILMLEGVFSVIFRRTGFRARMPFYWCAFWILYISGAGLINLNWRSMIRYVLPAFIFLVVCLMHLLEKNTPMLRWKWLAPVLGAVSFFLLYAQHVLLFRFSVEYGWVA